MTSDSNSFNNTDNIVSHSNSNQNLNLESKSLDDSLKYENNKDHTLNKSLNFQEQRNKASTSNNINFQEERNNASSEQKITKKILKNIDKEHKLLKNSLISKIENLYNREKHIEKNKNEIEIIL